MRTKIRLVLDFSIQLFLIILLLFQLVNNLSQSIIYLTWFALSISVWQIINALYLVQKNQNWYRKIYLMKIKKIAKIAFVFGLVGSLVYLFLPHYLQTSISPLGRWFSLGFSSIISLLALQYFGRSLVEIYTYYAKPKSFWDL